MQYRRSPDSAENQKNFVQRILHSLMPILLSRLVRLAGWGVVVGLPAMIFGPRRLAGLARRYPITSGTLCLGLLICVVVRSESNRSSPAEFEIESIDHIDEPTELIATFSPRLQNIPLDTASPRLIKFADPLGSSAAEARQPVPGTPEPQMRVEQTALGKPQAGTQPAGDTRIVWLTGYIEESPPGAPVRSAVRFLSNRR